MHKYKYFTEADITDIGRWIVKRQNSFIFNLINNYISSAKKISILEIGPGHGAFAIDCKERGYVYEAVECNEVMAECLRNKGVSVTVATVPPLPNGDNRDVIVMQHVLEHMKGVDEALALIHQCVNRLSPKGVLIVCCPDITVMKEDFFDCDYTHVFPTSERRLRQIFHDAGLNVVEAGLQNAFSTNSLLLKIMSTGARLAYSSGFFPLVFRNKAFLAKTSLYASCYIVGQFCEK